MIKEALKKEDIIKIINGCSNNKLETYIMFLAATGCRATEALSTRLKYHIRLNYCEKHWDKPTYIKCDWQIMYAEAKEEMK